MQYQRSAPAVLAALLVAGCGGGGGGGNQQPPAAAPAAPAGSTATATGTTVDIQMTGDGSTKAAYVPDHVTISPGTTLHFINVSGAPHNISFWADSIPSGGAAALGATMQNTIGELQGALLTDPNQTYDVSFAGAPPGEYKGYCVPHLALGMRLWVTVK